MKTGADLAIAPGITVERTSATQEVTDLGCLGVIAKVWDELGLTALLDSQIVVEEDIQLSSGLALKALVLNIIGGRAPLYRVQDWAEGVPLEVIVGKGVRAEQLNDTTLARHLDRLFDADGEKVFNAVCMRVIETEAVDTAMVHADTTSRLVFGEYLREEDEAISITRGHSKDKRPDLKQVMYGLAVSTDGIPLAGQLLPGNTSDKKWHSAMLNVVNEMLVVNKKGKSLHYVGDSALVTSANLGLAAKHGIVVTARIPRNVTLCRTAVERALKEPQTMTALGTFTERKGAASYEGCTIESCELFGHPVQLGVFRPTPSNELAKDKVDRRQRHALEDANKDASVLKKRRFGCESDARSSLTAFEDKHGDRLLVIKGDVVAEVVEGKRPRGRPRAGAEVPTTTQHRVTLTINGDDAGLQAEIEEESIFVLVHTGTTPLTAKAMLAAYKGQSVVEKRFPFLKDPAWAEVFFVKTPHRVEALGYVLLLALLVWCVWERRVRANLKASGEEPLIDTTKMPKKNPTAMVCRHIMASVKLVRRVTEHGCGPWRLVGTLTAEQQRVVRFSERFVPA